MKITVTRNTVGRLIGWLILVLIVAVVSYLGTAWVWWQLDPGYWSAAARGTALGFAVFLLLLRNVQFSIREE